MVRRGVRCDRMNNSLEQNLIDLGYKILNKEDVVKITFESEVLSGFKLCENTYIYDEDEEFGVRLGIGIELYIQNEEFNDFEEYGTLYWKVIYDFKKNLPSLESLTDNFKKYCGNSTKPAIEYNFEELTALDKKITSDNYSQ